MHQLHRAKRDIAGMSTSAWAVVCICVFVVAMGAGLGVFTPMHLPALPEPEITRYTVIRGGYEAPRQSVTSLTSFRVCSLSAEPCVIDGDTFRYSGMTIRIADIDAPETGGAKCEEEATLGRRATVRLAELLSSRSFELEAVGDRDVDRYGRKLRVVVSGGQSIGALLVGEGLARPWTGRRRPWC